MNPIQFQPGLSMAEFIRLHRTEARCRRALYRRVGRGDSAVPPEATHPRAARSASPGALSGSHF